MYSSPVLRLVCLCFTCGFLEVSDKVGTCSWEPPIGAFLLPRQADGEWWELADPTRSNRSYYYSMSTPQAVKRELI